MILQSLKNGAARLMGVSAIGKATVFGETEDFLKI
jgi:hypothetical protein